MPQPPISCTSPNSFHSSSLLLTAIPPTRIPFPFQFHPKPIPNALLPAPSCTPARLPPSPPAVPTSQEPFQAHVVHPSYLRALQGGGEPLEKLSPPRRAQPAPGPLPGTALSIRRGAVLETGASLGWEELGPPSNGAGKSWGPPTLPGEPSASSAEHDTARSLFLFPSFATPLFTAEFKLLKDL